MDQKQGQQQQQQQRQLLSVGEAADFLNLKESTIRAWILNRKIAYVKLGRRVFVRRSDAEQCIADSVVYPEERVAA